VAASSVAYAYFNNDIRAYAVRNAKTLKEQFNIFLKREVKYEPRITEGR
jgi:uncharacterized protein YecE (DUF72 family)